MPYHFFNFIIITIITIVIIIIIIKLYDYYFQIERVGLGQEEDASPPEPFEWDPNDE